MSLQLLQQSLPDYAKDIKLNLSNILNSETTLSKQQLWGVILATAYACKNPDLIKSVFEDAKNNLTAEAISAAKIAATLMGMNNIYYRFLHSVSAAEYSTMPANLRMTMMGQSGIDKKDFEMYSLAVSMINGCGFCMDAHEKSLMKLGASRDDIQTIARVTAIVSSLSIVAMIEAELA